MIEALHADRSHPDSELVDPVLVDAVWGRLQARLERGIGRIERTVSSLFDRSLEPAEIIEAVGVAELVAAKFGLLGLGSSAELTRKLAAVLQQSELGVGQAVSLSGLLDDIRLSMANTVAELKVLTHSGDHVAVVGAISETVDELLWVAAAQGLRVSHHADGMTGEVRDAAAVLVVIDDADVTRAKPLLRGIREVHPTQPVILLVPDGEVAARAQVVDLVTTIVPRALHPTEIVTEVRQDIVRHRQPRTLSVFGTNAELLAEPLWRRGLAATVERSVDELLQRLASGESRAAILMPNTPPLAAEQLLRLIRTDRRTRAAVVIVISEVIDTVRVQSALREGADDIFAARVDPDDLAVAIKSRLHRRAELEPVADPSEHRGTVPWPTATVMIERLLLVGFRRSSPVGIGLLRMRNDNHVRRDHGNGRFRIVDPDADALDEMIAKEFRSEDVIARLDADHLVVALQGVSRRTLMSRLGDLQQKFSLTDRGCRAIGMEFPIDGRSLSELLEAGRSAVSRVDEERGPWLAGADWRPWAAEAADVMLVDPDHTFGSVVTDALGRRGLRVLHEPDALFALDHLTGRSDLPLPRVVLMELDQRGIDGLQFLRQLRESGSLNRFKVIVLSTRTTDSDLRMALELGADDFVPKPISIPLLVHRLDRVLAP